MRYLLRLFILLFIAVGLGFLIHQDSGYVLITYQNWALQTSLWIALILIILIFFIFYFLLRLLKQPRLLKRRWENWKTAHQNGRLQKQARLALQQWANGEWQAAENTLAKGDNYGQDFPIRYLAMAYLAQLQKNWRHRDHYLQQAISNAQKYKVIIKIVQAQLYITGQEWELALSTLQALKKYYSRHPLLLNLLHQVYLATHDWQNLKILLPALKNKEILNLADFQKLEEKIYLNLLEQPILDLKALHEIWGSIPKHCKDNAEILYAYANLLVNLSQITEAKEFIEKMLKKNYYTQLVSLYKNLAFPNPIKQLIVAENWLVRYPDDPILLICLGELALKAEFLGKAKDYLTRSIEIHPSCEAHQLLSLVYLKLHEPQKELGCLRWIATHHSNQHVSSD